LPAMRLAQIASGDGGGVAGAWAACGADVVAGCWARPVITSASRMARYENTFFIVIALRRRDLEWNRCADGKHYTYGKTKAQQTTQRAQHFRQLHCGGNYIEEDGYGDFKHRD
jgi:hypothetical protein